MAKKGERKDINYLYIIIGALLIISSFRPEVVRSLMNWDGPRAFGYNITAIAIIVLAVWLIKKGLTKNS